METLKIDKTKLMTVKNYAMKMSQSTTWIYKQIESGILKSEKIDGVTFIKLH